MTAVDEGGTHGAFDGFFQIAISKHDSWVFATAFHRNVAQADSGGFHDDFAGSGFAGEGNGIDAFMFGKERTGGIGAETMYNVEYAGRHAAFVHHFTEQCGGSGGFFRRLHDNGVAAGQGRTDFPSH